MIRTSKWIAVNAPDQPLTEAARQALAARLATVWLFLAQSAGGAEDNVENVHQLRVWSRRAKAATTIFTDLLPPRRARWMVKQLDRIRRAAGVARDCDVLAERLARRAEKADGAALTATLERVRARRRAAQPPIDAMHLRLRQKRFDGRVAELVERVRFQQPGPEPDCATAGRLYLRTCVDEFFTAAEGTLSDVESLHGFRIAGKRLRYALEIFSGAFDAGLREDVYPVVEQLQEKLGQINDHATAQRQFEEWLETAGQEEESALRKLIKAEKSALRRDRRAFFAWWNAERSQALARRFDQLLSGRESREAG